MSARGPRRPSRLEHATAARAQRSLFRSANRTKRKELTARLRAQESLTQLGWERPTGQLDSLAQKLGVSEILSIPLHVKARLVVDRNVLRLEVSQDLDEGTRAFAIAHELGHIILEPERLASCYLGASGRGPSASPFSEIERLCDIVAEEILLPRRWFLGIRALTPSLDNAYEMAASAGCGLEIVAKRAQQLGWGGDCRFIWWQLRGESARAVKAVPEWTKSDLDLLWVDHDSIALLRECLLQSLTLKGKLTIDLWNDALTYDCECRKVSDITVVSLLHTTRAV